MGYGELGGFLRLNASSRLPTLREWELGLVGYFRGGSCYLPWLKVSVALRYVLTFPGRRKLGVRYTGIFRGSLPRKTESAGQGGSTEPFC